MKLKHLHVENFRGIKSLDWNLPDKKIFTLIGMGDSAKTTILEAIRYAFYPDWRAVLNDADFFNCDTTKPIEIRITFGSLPEQFLDLGKYGAYLRGWNNSTNELEDEPSDTSENVLTVSFQVSEDLEPKWKIVNSRSLEGTDFRTRDRRLINAGYIGISPDRHLSWGRGSVLSQIAEQSTDLSLVLAKAARSAKSTLQNERASLADLDAIAASVSELAKELGVPVIEKYQAHLDISAVRVGTGGLTLHDGEVPLKQLGAGSKRMLSSGLQKQAIDSTHVTLIDEIEIGLEPFRISRLLKHIKEDDTGQYFITTHSPVVLRELKLDDLYIVKSDGGHITVNSLDIDPDYGNFQGNLRSGAEAFLARKIVVCEGATEVGVCRGLDNYWSKEENKNPFSFEGVAMFNAGGSSKIESVALNLHKVGYNVAVFADSDSSQFDESKAKDLEGKGITTICWDWKSKYCTEQAIFHALPWSFVIETLNFLIDQNYDVRGSIEGSSILPKSTSKWQDTIDLREKIATSANSRKWFKRIDLAEDWISIISSSFSSDEILQSDFWRQITKLRTWIEA